MRTSGTVGGPSVSERGGGTGEQVQLSRRNFYGAKLHGEGEFALATDDQELEFAGRQDTLRMLERHSENVRIAHQAAADGPLLSLAEEEEEEEGEDSSERLLRLSSPGMGVLFVHT